MKNHENHHEFVAINADNIVVSVIRKKCDLPMFDNLKLENLRIVKWSGLGKPLEIGDKVTVWGKVGATFSYHAFHEAYRSLERELEEGLHPTFKPYFQRQKSLGFYEPDLFWRTSSCNEAKMYILTSCMTVENLAVGTPN